jgi:DNA-binding transcriptional LysR family regulator
MPRLPEFLRRHPDLEIVVVLDDRNVDLVQEGIDVGLRMGRLPDSALPGASRAVGMPFWEPRAISHGPVNPRNPTISPRTKP